MELEAVVDRVDVHAAVVGPVVRQGDNKLHSRVLRGLDDLVQGGEVDLHGAVRQEPLENGLLVSLAVLGEAVGVIGGVLVMEPPGAEHGETGVERGIHARLDVTLGLSYVGK